MTLRQDVGQRMNLLTAKLRNTSTSLHPLPTDQARDLELLRKAVGELTGVVGELAAHIEALESLTQGPMGPLAEEVDVTDATRPMGPLHQ